MIEMQEGKGSLTERGISTPGLHGKPVIKSEVRKGLSTTERRMDEEAIMLPGSRSKWIGMRTIGI